MNDRIQVRIREHGDLRKWKDIPAEVYNVRADENEGDINDLAAMLGQEREECPGAQKVVEVRWNYYINPYSGIGQPNLGQGHYIAVSGRYG